MEQNNNTNLNLNDLKNLLIIVDHAADSGAFKGWANIRKVMELRDKLENFIKSVDTKTENGENSKENPQKQQETSSVQNEQKIKTRNRK